LGVKRKREGRKGDENIEESLFFWGRVFEWNEMKILMSNIYLFEEYY
jgi:DNA-binding ferritin-like protein (Dps family)